MEAEDSQKSETTPAPTNETPTTTTTTNTTTTEETTNQPKGGEEASTASASGGAGDNLITLTIKTPKEKETVSVKPESTIKEVWCSLG